jgi:hypothetical protein
MYSDNWLRCGHSAYPGEAMATVLTQCLSRRSNGYGVGTVLIPEKQWLRGGHSAYPGEAMTTGGKCLSRRSNDYWLRGAQCLSRRSNDYGGYSAYPGEAMTTGRTQCLSRRSNRPRSERRLLNCKQRKEMSIPRPFQSGSCLEGKPTLSWLCLLKKNSDELCVAGNICRHSCRSMWLSLDTATLSRVVSSLQGSEWGHFMGCTWEVNKLDI